MSFEDDPADDRLQLDICIDEIKSLQAKIAALEAKLAESERDAKAMRAMEKYFESNYGLEISYYEGTYRITDDMGAACSADTLPAAILALAERINQP